MTVAANIKSLMKARNTDAAKLGRDAGLNYTGVYDVISGKSKNPQIHTIEKIAKALGVPIAYLFKEGSELDREGEMLSAFNQLSPEDQDRMLKLCQSFLPKS